MYLKLLEFLPVIAFFTAYKVSENLITATAIVIGSALAVTAIEYVVTRSISRMQVFLTAAILLFGIPTVLLDDPQIIKWKVTVVNMILASAIFICLFFLRKNPFSYLLGKDLPLPEQAWNMLAKWWMIYFVFAAILNAVIAFCLPALFGVSEKAAESLWVDYKTFGNAGLNLVFALICGFALYKTCPGILSEARPHGGDADSDRKQ